MEKASAMHQDLSGKALQGSQSLGLCKVTDVAVQAFFLQKLQCTENVKLQQQQDLHLFIPNGI